MGPKPAGNKEKGKQILASVITPFDPTAYGTLEVVSSISLLTSPEENVVLRALYIICKYGQESIPNIKMLFDNGLLGECLSLIQTTVNTGILKFCLKLVAMMIQFPEAIAELTKCDRHPNILGINNYFMTTTDPKIQEFTSQILCKTVTNTVIASMLFNAEVIGPIFNILQNSTDPDTIRNTLEYHLKVISCQEAAIILSKMKEFSPKILLCYLRSDFPDIQHLAINILVLTTSWKNTEIQILFKNEGIVQAMLQIITNNELPDLHQDAFDVIHNCFECEETATYFIGTVEFLEFALWAKTCPKKYMICTATVFKILTDYKDARQILFDFSVEESILSMFRTNNEKVQLKVCEAISNMATHRYCLEKMLTPVVIKSLIEILRRNDVPTIPYVEAAIKTVYDFLRRNRKMLRLFFCYGGLEAIGNILRSQTEMTQSGFSMSLDILYRYSVEDQYKFSVMDKELYTKVFQLFTEDDIDFSKQAIAILDQYIKDEESRLFFIECDGPRRVLEKLKDNEAFDNDLLKYILIFISRIFIYKTIGMMFLMNEALMVLKGLNETDEETNPIINRLINMMYDLYLPLKFFEKKKLEVTDYIKDRFYLVCGCWKGPFPFLEVLESQKISTCKTIYVADFTAPSDLLKTLVIAQRDQPCKGSSRRSSNQKGSKGDSTSKERRRSVSMEVPSSHPKRSVSASFMCNIMFERITPLVNYGGLSRDPYLTEYLEELYNKMYGEKAPVLPIEEQVRILADYVDKHLSGSEWYPPEAKMHAHKLHLNALKERLGTNMIPIGFVRHGNYCERALLFKALADKLAIPATLVRGPKELHWNEVPLEAVRPDKDSSAKQLTFFVVDLMNNVGNLMEVGSPEARQYCGFISKSQ